MTIASIPLDYENKVSIEEREEYHARIIEGLIIKHQDKILQCSQEPSFFINAESKVFKLNNLLK